MIDGIIHREDGPAVKIFHFNGALGDIGYYYRGHALSPYEFRLHCLMVGNFKGLEDSYV